MEKRKKWRENLENSREKLEGKMGRNIKIGGNGNEGGPAVWEEWEEREENGGVVGE